MHSLKDIKSGLTIGITFLATVLFCTAVYALINHVNSSDTLLSNTLNSIIDGGVPTGYVSAFNQSTCPTGWLPADGANGTPDLRGEFIRGLDNGRGIDIGRTLASYQSGTLLPRILIGYDNPRIAWANQADSSWNQMSNWDSITQVAATNTRRINISYISSSAGGNINAAFRIHPRNIAFLYCVKS